MECAENWESLDLLEFDVPVQPGVVRAVSKARLLPLSGSDGHLIAVSSDEEAFPVETSSVPVRRPKWKSGLPYYPWFV